MSEEQILRNTLGNQEWWVNRTLIDMKRYLGILAGQQNEPTPDPNRRLTAAVDQNTRATKNRNRVIEVMTESMSSNMAHLGYNLRDLGKSAWSANTGLDKLLAPLIGMGGLFGFAVSELTDMVDVYRQSVAMGMTFNGSIFQMAEAAHRAGLTVDEMAGMMKEHQGVLSAYGPERMAEMTGAARSFMHQFGMFGLTIQEANKWFGDYLETQRMLGQSEKLTTEAVAKAFSSLIANSTALARVTGRQRDEVLQEMMESRKETNFALTEAILRAEGRGEDADNFRLGIDAAKAIGGEQGRILAEQLNLIAQGQSPHIADKDGSMNTIYEGQHETILRNMFGGQYKDMAEATAALQKMQTDLPLHKLKQLQMLGIWNDDFGKIQADAWAAKQGLADNQRDVEAILKDMKGLRALSRTALSLEDVVAQFVQKGKAPFTGVLADLEGVLNDGVEGVQRYFAHVMTLKPEERIDAMLKDLPAMFQAATAKWGEEGLKQIEGLLPEDAAKSLKDMAADAEKVLTQIHPEWERQFAAGVGKTEEWIKENKDTVGVAAAMVAAVGGAVGLKKLLDNNGNVRAGITANNLPGGASLGQTAATYSGNLNAAGQLPAQAAPAPQAANPAMGGGLPGAMQDLAVAARQLSDSATNMNDTMTKLVVGASLFAAVEAALALFQAANNPLSGMTDAVASLNTTVQRLETSTGSGDLLMSLGILNTSMGTLNQSMTGMTGLSTIGDTLSTSSLRLETSLTQLDEALRQVAANTQQTAAGVAETNTRLQRLHDLMDQVRASTRTLAENSP